MFLTETHIQEIAETSALGGYDFQTALRTAERDGTAWYRRETPDEQYERELREAHKGDA